MRTHLESHKSASDTTHQVNAQRRVVRRNVPDEGVRVTREYRKLTIVTNVTPFK